MQGRLLLDVVVREGAAVLELLAGKDQALLVGRGALLVLDLLLDVVDRVARLDVERDGLARERLDEDLRAVFGSVAESFWVGAFWGQGARLCTLVDRYGLWARRRRGGARSRPVLGMGGNTRRTGSLWIASVFAPARPRLRQRNGFVWRDKGGAAPRRRSRRSRGAKGQIPQRAPKPPYGPPRARRNSKLRMCDLTTSLKSPREVARLN